MSELDILIDTQLPHRPRFHRQEVEVAGQTMSMYSRNIVECVKALYSSTKFAEDLVFRPERHYDKDNRGQRYYHDLHTGEWWWQMQVRLKALATSLLAGSLISPQMTLEEQKPGATVVPILLSSDRTQVTQFGSKSAYPVYLTIGNLPKDIRRKPGRRGQVLLAYLPTTKLKHVASHAA